MTAELPGNSNKSKELQAKTKPKQEKVITGEVIIKEKGIGHKFKSVFFGGSFKTAVAYVVADVILPQIRNMMADASKGAIDRVIYGESVYQRRRAPDYHPRTSYHNPFSRVQPDPRDRAYLPDQPPHPFRRSANEVGDFILPTKEMAEVILEHLIEIVNQYDAASLGDLLDLMGEASSHTDEKWGWTHLRTAQIVQVREGFKLVLPPLEPL